MSFISQGSPLYLKVKINCVAHAFTGFYLTCSQRCLQYHRRDSSTEFWVRERRQASLVFELLWDNHKLKSRMTFGNQYGRRDASREEGLKVTGKGGANLKRKLPLGPHRWRGRGKMWGPGSLNNVSTAFPSKREIIMYKPNNKNALQQEQWEAKSRGLCENSWNHRAKEEQEDNIKGSTQSTVCNWVIHTDNKLM